MPQVYPLSPSGPVVLATAGAWQDVPFTALTSGLADGQDTMVLNLVVFDWPTPGNDHHVPSPPGVTLANIDPATGRMTSEQALASAATSRS